jgi:hypothetical protein
LGEGLRGNANRLNFVAPGFEGGFGPAQHLERVGDLGLVLDGVEIDEGGDGADFWLCQNWDGNCGGFGLGEAGGGKRKNSKERKRKPCARKHGILPQPR